MNELKQTFIDANKDLMYLKDENLKYVFINKAVEAFYNKKSEEIIGQDDFSLTEEEFALKRRKTDMAVLEKNALIIDEVVWQGRTYKTTKFPVKLMNGRYGVGAYVTDITDEKESDKKQEKRIHRYKVLADIFTHSFKDKQEQMDYVLNEAIKLTESHCGCIFLYDEEKEELHLRCLAGDVTNEVDIAEVKRKYHLNDAGLWGKVILKKEPVVINDFENSHHEIKVFPEGYVKIEKLMLVPVVIDDRIKAVVGLANKKGVYDNNDVYEIDFLMNGTWNAIERRDAQEKLFQERNKYLQILISIGDGVIVIDKNGYVEMLNKAAERLTGWSKTEARGKHYKEIFKLSHEQEGMEITDPVAEVFATDTVQVLGNHAMLTSKDGTKYYLEDSAAPIKDDMNQTIGVVLVFRDVTEKKEQRKKIEFFSFRDTLTGLYNRRFFQNEIERLDNKENLPLSIIMADVNGLKLTNDIFGHSYGDILLEKISDVFKRVCRKEDIIARLGGDEFVLVLPKTTYKDAEKIIKRIKKEFSLEKVKTVKCSISMGVDTKEKMEENIIDVINRAEERMYLAKTIENKELESTVVENIITALHEISKREEEHSQRVSELCKEFGKILNLPEVDIRKLTEAGYLHDIGKIALDHDLLREGRPIDSHQKNEIKKHSIVGYRILNSFECTLDLAETVLAHHERWDGKGHPKGLKGNEIPLLARIIALAESYDRMIHGYGRNKVMSKEEAIEVIRQNAGVKFDPHLSEIFINMVTKNNINSH